MSDSFAPRPPKGGTPTHASGGAVVRRLSSSSLGGGGGSTTISSPTAIASRTTSFQLKSKDHPSSPTHSRSFGGDSGGPRSPRKRVVHLNLAEAPSVMEDGTRQTTTTTTMQQRGTTTTSSTRITSGGSGGGFKDQPRHVQYSSSSYNAKSILASSSSHTSSSPRSAVGGSSSGNVLLPTLHDIRVVDSDDGDGSDDGDIHHVQEDATSPHHLVLIDNPPPISILTTTPSGGRFGGKKMKKAKSTVVVGTRSGALRRTPSSSTAVVDGRQQSSSSPNLHITPGGIKRRASMGSGIVITSPGEDDRPMTSSSTKSSKKNHNTVQYRRTSSQIVSSSTTPNEKSQRLEGISSLDFGDLIPPPLFAQGGGGKARSNSKPKVSNATINARVREAIKEDPKLMEGEIRERRLMEEKKKRQSRDGDGNWIDWVARNKSDNGAILVPLAHGGAHVSRTFSGSRSNLPKRQSATAMIAGGGGSGAASKYPTTGSTASSSLPTPVQLGLGPLVVDSALSPSSSVPFLAPPPPPTLPALSQLRSSPLPEGEEDQGDGGTPPSAMGSPSMSSFASSQHPPRIGVPHVHHFAEVPPQLSSLSVVGGGGVSHSRDVQFDEMRKRERSIQERANNRDPETVRVKRLTEAVILAVSFATFMERGRARQKHDSQVAHAKTVLEMRFLPMWRLYRHRLKQQAEGVIARVICVKAASRRIKNRGKAADAIVNFLSCKHHYFTFVVRWYAATIKKAQRVIKRHLLKRQCQVELNVRKCRKYEKETYWYDAKVRRDRLESKVKQAIRDSDGDLEFVSEDWNAPMKAWRDNQIKLEKDDTADHKIEMPAVPVGSRTGEGGKMAPSPRAVPQGSTRRLLVSPIYHHSQKISRSPPPEQQHLQDDDRNMDGRGLVRQVPLMFLQRRVRTHLIAKCRERCRRGLDRSGGPQGGVSGKRGHHGVGKADSLSGSSSRIVAPNGATATVDGSGAGGGGGGGPAHFSSWGDPSPPVGVFTAHSMPGSTLELSPTGHHFQDLAASGGSFHSLGASTGSLSLPGGGSGGVALGGSSSSLWVPGRGNIGGNGGSSGNGGMVGGGGGAAHSHHVHHSRRGSVSTILSSSSSAPATVNGVATNLESSLFEMDECRLVLDLAARTTGSMRDQPTWGAHLLKVAHLTKIVPGQ